MERKKAEGVYFSCFHLRKVESQVICQEGVSAGQCSSSKERNNETRVLGRLTEAWGARAPFIIVHHSVMVRLAGTLLSVLNGHQDKTCFHVLSR